VAACKPGGTGAPFFDSDYEVACKTGTAQQGGEDALPHAWFTVYAPAKDPEIVIAILAEKAGQGSQEAAPVAKRLLDWWFAQPEEYRTTK
jgi:penicillin-binding protein 2